MKKSPIFWFKTSLLIIGTILILTAGFLPVQSQDYFIGPDESETATQIYRGIYHPLWYVLIIATGIIFSIGYFSNKSANVILVYAITPILLAIFLFLSAAFSITWGAMPLIPQFEYGYTMMTIGSLAVFVATVISMHRKSNVNT